MCRSTNVTEGAEGCDFRSTYWTWDNGRRNRVFAHVQLKNKDSLEADINGTFAGPDGDPATEEDRYGDYETYTAGQQQHRRRATTTRTITTSTRAAAGVEDVNYSGQQRNPHGCRDHADSHRADDGAVESAGAPVGRIGCTTRMAGRIGRSRSLPAKPPACCWTALS
ncbi:MAG: hypothetical protein ACLR23_28385 [Clostridia bacterium]